ncbi:conserved hypothetical protein [Seinonella peptonophila]|uniref:EthD domain-containing protein n=1 Tax=Seinonella peptonophila TaxID=112248 RepID=A0A1M4SZ12_9BACL|nr:EthD family reductase [Seinonella peptonophila]SHE37384.1 conserved hypothetical protein [Seinonella peptonophila]
MVKVVTLFYQAEEPNVLDDYYYNHYLPMVLRIPGLIKVETNQMYTDMKKVLLRDTDLTPMYQIISEMYFKDLSSFEEGFKTEEGEYIANSAIKVAWDLITCVIGDVTIVTPEEFENNPGIIRRLHRS